MKRVVDDVVLVSDESLIAATRLFLVGPESRC
jgi:hypothetical protein